MISGGENDPLGGTFIIEYLRVYDHVLCCTDEPAAMRVDFVLDPNGRIIPALSFGKEIKLIQIRLLPIRLSVY